MPEPEGRRIDFYWAGSMMALLALLFVLLLVFGGAALPVLLALALAYILNPAVTWLEKKRINRTAGSAIVFAAMVLLIVAASLYLVPVFSSQAEKLPGFIRRAADEVGPRLEELTGLPIPELLRERASDLAQQASDLLQSAGPAAARFLGKFAQNTVKVLTIIVGLLVVPVLAFFFVQDYPSLVQMGRDLLPRRGAPLLSRRFAQVDAVLSAFVRGQVIVGSILAAIYSVGLAFARIELAVVIGVIAGFGNMVPYLGTFVGIVLAVIGVLLSWEGAWQLVAVAATFLIGQLLEGLVITPRIVGDQVGLSPVAVIIAVLAFGELFGFVGILLAVPVSAILKVMLSVVVERYRKTPAYTGEPA